MAQMKRHIRNFWRCESGSQTIEFVIWMPIFVFVIAITMNVSMVFYKESLMQRVVQDANRSFAMNRIQATSDAETYVLNKIGFLKVANPSVTSDLSGGVITTQLSVPATDLMPFRMFDSYFSDVPVTVYASHFVEY